MPTPIGTAYLQDSRKGCLSRYSVATIGSMRRILRVVPVVVAVAALLQSGVRPFTEDSAEAQSLWSQAEPVRIMPLGDSNTAGADNAQGGYRTDLWQLLTADGRSVDFVGSLSSGAAALGDKNHEGHGGWTIQGIHDNVIGWLQTYRPDVVLLQIGTNDMYDDTAAGGAPARLAALLDRILATATTAQIYVTNIPPINDPGHHRRAQAFNATIPAIAASRSRVTYVDTASALVAPYDFVDALHPTYGGASRAAARWYSALTGIPLTRYEAEQTPNASLVRATRVTGNVSSSGGTKVGYIDFADSAVTFRVYVASTGTHRIRIRAGNGMGTNCSHRLSVNGGAVSTVTYPSLGWEQWIMVGVDVSLNAGPNTLRFTKGDCYAELDSIDVS
jgi:lysophospholipase L1-like esterase